MGQRQSLEDLVFELRCGTQTLKRQATHCTIKRELDERLARRCVSKQDNVNARLHLESAYRNRKQETKYTRLAGRVETIAQQVDTAQQMKSLSGQMKAAVKQIGAVISSMDTKKINDVLDGFSRDVLKLEKVYKDVDEKIEDAAIDSDQEDEVDEDMNKLIEEQLLQMNDVPVRKQVRDEHVMQQQQQNKVKRDS